MNIRENLVLEKRQDRFFQELIQFIRDQGLLQAHEKIMVAVSGGLDSTVLLHALYRVTRLFEVSLEVAHVDHKTRGPASSREGTWVRVLCERLHLPFHSLKLPEPIEKGSQAQFRDARRSLLLQLAQERKCHKIATAHHATDNVETLLMRMMSGTGSYGLASIRPRSGIYVRPLLWALREDLVDYARNHNLSWIEDPTNQEDYYLRNKIRHELLPKIEAVRESSVKNLSRLALRVGEEESDFETWIQGQFEGPRHVLPLSLIERYPKALQRRFLRIWLDRQGLGQDSQLLEALLQGQERVHPAGSFLRRSDSWIYFNESDFGDSWAQSTSLELGRRFSLGNSVAWSYLPFSKQEGVESHSLSLLANFRSPLDSLKVARRSFCLDIAWSRAPWPVAIGTLGKLTTEARRRVQEVFAKYRIPEGYRKSWPVLVSPEHSDMVIGLVGLEVFEEFRPGTLERRVSIEHLLEDSLKAT